jgi:citrate synthase
MPTLTVELENRDPKTNDYAELGWNGKKTMLPLIEGTAGERAIDVSKLRDQTGLITLDSGYGNTGSCQSAITFIDGEKGILRYRGIPIEELAKQSSFIETALLIIYGKLPTRAELGRFSDLLSKHELIHEDMKFHFEGFPPKAHPMAILASMINAADCYYPEPLAPQESHDFANETAFILSQVRTIAAFAYRKSRGLPFIYPKPQYEYSANFLHMMFSAPYADYELKPEVVRALDLMKPEVVRALDLIFLLHADHEQNCSTSTVRMVASSKANLFASIASGVCALWGPLHGGANQAVLEMLEQIHRDGDDGSRFMEAAKDKKGGRRLTGFGHRVYKNYDPRAKIIKKQCDELFAALQISDPLLDIAMRLEQAALHDPYFIERKLYPNVDFYSGIMMRAIGIPVEMFTVIFAIGRMPGWIANYREVSENEAGRICRPRQIYIGEPLASYVPIDQRANRR